MSKKSTFLNTDKLWYVSYFTDAGDFAKLSEKGYETLELANASANIPAGTPAGELVTDEAVLEPATPEPTVEETPAEAVTEATPEVAQVQEQVETLEEKVDALEEKVEDLAEAQTAPVEPTPETGLESVPQGTDNGPVDPATVQGELSAEPVAEVTAPTTEEAPVDTVKTEETAPVNA